MEAGCFNETPLPPGILMCTTYYLFVPNKMMLATSQFIERNLQLRTKEVHNAYYDSLGGPLNDHIATTFGIVRKSILNDLNHFHVVTGLVPDIIKCTTFWKVSYYWFTHMIL